MTTEYKILSSIKSPFQALNYWNVIFKGTDNLYYCRQEVGRKIWGYYRSDSFDDLVVFVDNWKVGKKGRCSVIRESFNDKGELELLLDCVRKQKKE